MVCRAKTLVQFSINILKKPKEYYIWRNPRPIINQTHQYIQEQSILLIIWPESRYIIMLEISCFLHCIGAKVVIYMFYIMYVPYHELYVDFIWLIGTSVVIIIIKKILAQYQQISSLHMPLLLRPCVSGQASHCKNGLWLRPSLQVKYLRKL